MQFSKEQATIHRVITEAWGNPDFKQRLIENPVMAIKALTGCDIEVPNGKTLSVFDQSDKNMVCLNIPQQPSFDDEELTTGQIDAVTGGEDYLSLTAIDWKVFFTETFTSDPPNDYK